jgi:hypothetical protein
VTEEEAFDVALKNIDAITPEKLKYMSCRQASLLCNVVTGYA